MGFGKFFSRRRSKFLNAIEFLGREIKIEKYYRDDRASMKFKKIQKIKFAGIDENFLKFPIEFYGFW